MPNRTAQGKGRSTTLQTKKSALKARVREKVVAELEHRYFQGRTLTGADLAFIVATIADAEFHEEYDQILNRDLGPHLSSTVKVLTAIAKPDGSVSPQHCRECHATSRTGFVAATKGDTRLAAHIAEHPGFRELSELGSSAQVRALAEHLRALDRLHSTGSWKHNQVRFRAGDPLVIVPWRRSRVDVTTRDRALLALLAGSWPMVNVDAEPEHVIQAEMECLRKQMRRADTKRKRRQPP